MEEYDSGLQRGINALEEHAKLIGNVTIAWNTAQSLVFTIFSVASGMKYDNAVAVFFALKTDFAQRDITIAVLDSELTGKTPEVEKLRDRIKRPINKLNSLASERNAAIHTMWGYVHEEGDVKVAPQPSVKHHPSLKVDDAAAQMVRLEEKLGSVVDTLIRSLHELGEYRAWQNTPDPRTRGRKETR